MNAMRVLLLIALAVTTAAGADADGTVVYDRYCAGCHGVAGDGNGPAADMLLVKPRDFTKGVFKFRTTPAGTLPTDDDLFRTITRGIHRTSMPEWTLLPESERWALVRRVKAFYPDWATQSVPEPVAIPRAPRWVWNADAAARGKEVYALLECATCHGESGRGDGPSAATLAADAWGHPQKPFDFTKGRLKSGGAPEDVYRTFMTGLNGTAMPSYEDIFAAPDGENIYDGDAWNLVAYVLSLRTPAEPARKDAAP